MIEKICDVIMHKDCWMLRCLVAILKPDESDVTFLTTSLTCCVRFKSLSIVIPRAFMVDCDLMLDVPTVIQSEDGFCY